MYRDSSLCDVSVMFWGFGTWPPNQNHPCIITLQYMYVLLRSTLKQKPIHPTPIRKPQRYLIWNSPALFVPSYHLPSTPRALENFCMLSSLLSTMALYRLHRDCLSSCVSLSYRPWSNNTSWAWPFTSFLINTVKDTKKNLRHL